MLAGSIIGDGVELIIIADDACDAGLGTVLASGKVTTASCLTEAGSP